jgi:hypothetical protein
LLILFCKIVAHIAFLCIVFKKPKHIKMLKMRLLGLVAMLSIALCGLSQVTTSSITGNIQGEKGILLDGATITAIHQPTGSQYITSSKKGGGFTIPAARIGGPYKITVSYAGYAPSEFDNIYLALGDAYNLNVAMVSNSSNLGNVVVSGIKRKIGLEKSGASTSVGLRQLQTLPTISRSITDFTRLTPQANGNSIGGRDGRYNNITIDGANLNNNFGLSTDALPGGGNPISLDAIEEISVNIAPYDVRQANFTGANIAAVTKSGSNTFHGSAYGLFRNQNYSGLNISSVKLATPPNSKNVIFGGTLGGPIIKNKLFFFASYENEERTFPGITWSPTGGTGAGNKSSVPIDSLKKLSDFLQANYGYSTGAYDNFPNFASKNTKLLGRLDWNINKQHKVTLKYSDFDSRNDVAVNSFSTSALGNTFFTSVARFGTQAMSFANSNYSFHDVVKSLSFELNSNFRSKFANQVLATYTKVRTTRETASPLFPFVDILRGTNNYMSFGRELFSNNNDVKNNTLLLTDNLSYFAGKHTITAGISYEAQTVGNQFMPASQGYYVYNSLNDFITNAAPRAFTLTYSVVPGDDAPYSANLEIGQLGIYAQDEIKVNPSLKLNFGLRVDRPIYQSQPVNNPAIQALNLYNKDGGITNYSTGMWPKATNYISPRAGFRWDVEGDKVLVIHGSTGLYTGRIPFVYLTNMPSNSGVYQRQEIATAAQLATIRFDKDAAKTYKSLFPQTANASAPSGGFVAIDPNFKFPQIFRTNLGFDRKFGEGWNLGVDALFTKDINSIYMFNANQSTPTSTVTLGSTIRPAFANSTAATRRLNAGIANAIVLTNSNKGAAFSLTTQVSKSYAKGFNASLAYTYTYASDITANPGSTANSVWIANATSGTQNTIESAYSNFAAPHRLVGSLSYTKEYFKTFASTFTFFYEGATQGTYSYVYNGDVNFDGNSSDLMYIPSSPAEANFATTTVSGVTFTAQQQSDAFFKYLEQDKYLNTRKGTVAQRNGARLPWYNRVDFRFLQDVFKNIGKNKHTIQLSLDCTNFLNLLNKDWGIRNLAVVSNPLRIASITAGVPTYNLATYTPFGTTVPRLIDRTFINNNSLSSTWGIQIGARYKF